MNNLPVLPKIAAFAVLVVLLAGCGALAPAPTPTPLPTATATATITPTRVPFIPPAEGRIIYQKPDGRKFAGTIHGQGRTAVIMANMSRGGETQWDLFVEAVDKQKFTVVTFLRLEADVAGMTEDMNIILQQLRESGYTRVACIGASLGVTSCGTIAEQPEMAGLVMIAGPNDAGTLEKITYPKLFIAGAGDPFSVDTQKTYDQAAEPKKLVLFADEGRHGTDIFYSSDYKDELLKLLIDFVNDLS